MSKCHETVTSFLTLVTNSKYLSSGQSFLNNSIRAMGTYLFPISHDYVVNVLRITPLSQIVLDPVLIEDIQKAAFWSSEYL